MITTADLFRALEDITVLAVRADQETLATIHFAVSRASDQVEREWRMRQTERAEMNSYPIKVVGGGRHV